MQNMTGRKGLKMLAFVGLTFHIPPNR
jgi:hypothetical protein